MNIGELAKRSGLTQSRIRFYESIGLLKMVERRPNGYRTYPREAALVLDLIATAQHADSALMKSARWFPPTSRTGNMARCSKRCGAR
jgi:DNA-binding transcriptional MerR regulator